MPSSFIIYHRCVHSMLRYRLNVATQTGTVRLSVRLKSSAAPDQVKWYYATDVPLRKPERYNYKMERPPSKFTKFSEYDDVRLERAYRKHKPSLSSTEVATTSKVLVNEDGLFLVDLNSMELAPVYWEGPVYEVRRGLWFTSDGVPLPEADTQEIEQKYQSIKPKNIEPSMEVELVDDKEKDLQDAISVSEDDNDSLVDEVVRLSHEIPDTISEAAKKFADEVPDVVAAFNKLADSTVETVDTSVEKDIIQLQSGTNVMFFKELPGHVAQYPKEYNTRFQIEVLRNLGPKRVPLVGVTYVQRGYSADLDELVLTPPKNPIPALSKTLEAEITRLLTSKADGDIEAPIKKQQQDLAGHMMTSDYTQDPTRPAREIDHLVLCVHGIGQVLGDKYELINFTHLINMMRKTMNKVYQSDPQYHKHQDAVNNRIQVLPISWRHRVDFQPTARYESESQRLPSLLEINADGVKPLRNVVGDVVLDVLLFYEPHYFKQVMQVVAEELNRVYHEYKRLNPHFKGKVHLLGHSLGSAIAFDMACQQQRHHDEKSQSMVTPVSKSKPTKAETDKLQLDFEIHNLFCVGSPVGMFNLLKQRNIGTSNDSWVMRPKVRNLFNLYHPCDPVAYRMEPLVDPDLAKYKAELVPFATDLILLKIQGLNEMGSDISNMFSQATSWLTTSTAKKAIALKDIEKLKQLAEDENALGDILQSIAVMDKEKTKTRKVDMNLALLSKVLPLNGRGRIDYTLPMGVFDFSLVSAVSAHVLYFEDEDTAGFLVREILNTKRPVVRKEVYTANN